MEGAANAERMPTLADVTAEEWQRLGARRLFFGHQSVGGNLIQGVEEVLAANPHIPLRVVETADAAQMAAPGLYHANVGTNGAPDSKLQAFANVVGGGIGASGTALLKFCYVDVTAATDPDSLFQSYRRTVDSVKTAHPTLTVAHVTLPLTVDRGFVFHAKTVLRGNGAGSDRQLNLKRDRYNQLLRTTYAREPIFDLARLESVGQDHRLVDIRYKGQSVPALAPEWTFDGTHLNEVGRQRFAETFLAALAKL